MMEARDFVEDWKLATGLVYILVALLLAFVVILILLNL